MSNLASHFGQIPRFPAKKLLTFMRSSQLGQKNRMPMKAPKLSFVAALRGHNRLSIDVEMSRVDLSLELVDLYYSRPEPWNESKGK
ncbi:MAG: hypothetical protein ABGX07_07760 [Pirellulaceae bacterium]